MDEITRKRPGRPRKVVADAVAREQDASAPANEPGFGQVGEVESGAPEVASRESKGLDWHGMTVLVLSKHKRDHQISCIWHPEAVGETFETPHLGNIRVQVGPAQYQLNTGEMVAL